MVAFIAHVVCPRRCRWSPVRNPLSFARAKASLRRFGNLNGGRFALVGVFIDVQPFVVDGVFHAAESFE